jgi:hypothetical protein
MKSMSQIVADANRAQTGYLKPDQRERCGSCISCKPYVTDAGVKTNSNQCDRYMHPVQLHGWCPRFRSIP